MSITNCDLPDPTIEDSHRKQVSVDGEVSMLVRAMPLTSTRIFSMSLPSTPIRIYWTRQDKKNMSQCKTSGSGREKAS